MDFFFIFVLGDVNKIYERIEDVVAQADEVDGKMLQFEGMHCFHIEVEIYSFRHTLSFYKVLNSA